jgi:hypothetical protein
MNTTTAPAASPAVGCILPPDQFGWERSDWIDAYQDAYSRSVIWAADDDCLLSLSDLMRLLDQHGARLIDLDQDLEACHIAGHGAHDRRHAGQALTWLGY